MSPPKHAGAILLVTAVIHWLLWLGYTNNAHWREIVAGAVASLFATGAVAIFAFQARIAFRFRWADAVQMVYLPWLILRGTAKVLQATAMQIFTARGAVSGTIAVPYNSCGNDPLSAGRRALAVSFTTITPDSVVLGVVKDQQLLLCHQILPGRINAMTRRLGATP